jgi:hypothetical protein
LILGYFPQVDQTTDLTGGIGIYKTDNYLKHISSNPTGSESNPFFLHPIGRRGYLH